MKKATFDPSRLIYLYFRCNRAGSKTFVLLDGNGDPLNVGGIYTDYGFELFIKKYPGERPKTISLTIGNGLVINGNQLIFSVTAEDTKIDTGEYYWELYLNETEKTWLNGKAIFHNGEFDGVENETASVTISEAGETIEITIQDSIATGGGGGGTQNLQEVLEEGSTAVGITNDVVISTSGEASVSGTGGAAIANNSQSSSVQVTGTGHVVLITNGSTRLTIEDDGDTIFAGQRLQVIGTPTASTDAATKAYVDQYVLNPTNLKTGNYNAVAGDYIPVDTTSGAVTITLPTAPAQGTIIAIKRVAGATNNVTYTCGGSDVLNLAGGATSGNLTIVNQQVTLIYRSTGAIWYVETSLSLSSLDARFVPKDIKSFAYFYSDFGAMLAPYVNSASGTGATAAISSIAGTATNPGTATCQTGSTNAGQAYVTLSASFNNFLLGGGAWVFDSVFYINVLPVLAERFVTIAGYHDSPSTSDATDGVYFRHVDDVNGGRWQAITRSNSTETATDTGITPVAATNASYQIDVNAAGTQAVFRINRTIVATHTTNIPASAGRQATWCVGLRKTTGTTAMSLVIDYVNVINELTTAR